MKKRNFKKRLNLSKITISDLSNFQLNKVNGGAPETNTCPSVAITKCNCTPQPTSPEEQDTGERTGDTA